MSVVISGVQKGSSADKAGIKPGELLVLINGSEVNDVLDYRFYITEANPRLTLEDKNGLSREVGVKKQEYADPGLEFETYLMDGEKSCKNKCVFCFIDQLPSGMRPSLYFKDDDSRLGFLFGNYVTLTNLEERDIERIIKMRVSPVNISVHTMNPSLRVEMMKNPRAGDSLSFIPRLCSAGIMVNIQLVLCPGINDGKELERSLKALSLLGESLQSVAAVPVGLTKFRSGLPCLRLFTSGEAKDAVETVERYGDMMLEKTGSRVFYASDELYLTAGIPMPDYGHYGDFYQLENGVGMSALLEYEFEDALSSVSGKSTQRRVTIATGTAAAPLIKGLAQKAEAKFPGLKAEVIPVTNNFFGKTITVAGLVTGGDIIAQMKERDIGESLLFPSSMLRYEGDLFLDGVSVPELEEALGVPAIPVPNSGQALLEAMLGKRF